MVQWPEDEDVQSEEEGSYPPPFFDKAGVWIMAEQCSTCIFRPGNLMQLNEGRMKDLTQSCDRADTNVICHQTLSDDVGALCKGSVDRRPGQMVRIAERLGAIKERTVG